MEVFLGNNIASARKILVLGIDEYGCVHSIIFWILGPVDETDQIAVVEIFESMHLIHNGGDHAQPVHDKCGHFETHIHADSADVKKQISGRRDGVMDAFDFSERVQLRWPPTGK